MTMLLECWQFSRRVSFSVRFTFPEAQNRKGSNPHFSSQDEIEVWFEVRLFLPAVLSFSRRTESRVQGEQSAPTQLPFCFLPSLFLVTSHSSLFLVTYPFLPVFGHLPVSLHLSEKDLEKNRRLSRNSNSAAAYPPYHTIYFWPK